MAAGTLTRAELELIDGADSIAAEDVDDAEEQAQADEEAEAAAAEALVETTLEMVDAKKCGLCYEWFEAEQMRWDAEPYCYSAGRLIRTQEPGRQPQVLR